MKRANPFRGRWRIVSTGIWDRKDLEDLGPAHVTFGPDRTGELNLIAIAASVDYRVGTRDGAPDSRILRGGDDDGHPTFGRARLDGGGLVDRLFIHQGDEAEFVAKRLPAR